MSLNHPCLFILRKTGFNLFKHSFSVTVYSHMDILWVALFKLSEVICLIKVPIMVEWAQRPWCCNLFSHSTWPSCFYIKLLTCWFVTKFFVCTLDVGKPHFSFTICVCYLVFPTSYITLVSTKLFFFIYKVTLLSQWSSKMLSIIFLLLFHKEFSLINKNSNSKVHCYHLHLPILTTLVIISLSLIQVNWEMM